MNRNELLNLFRELASDIAEKDFSEVAEESRVAELGIDSLGLMELVGTLERELSVRLPEDKLGTVKTVGDLLSLAEAARQA